MVAVHRGGIMTVVIGEALVEGDPLSIVHTQVSTTATVGRFVKTPSAGKTALINGAEVVSGAEAGGIAIVYIPEGAVLTPAV